MKGEGVYIKSERWREARDLEKMQKEKDRQVEGEVCTPAVTQPRYCIKQTI